MTFRLKTFGKFPQNFEFLGLLDDWIVWRAGVFVFSRFFLNVTEKTSSIPKFSGVAQTRSIDHQIEVWTKQGNSTIAKRYLIKTKVSTFVVAENWKLDVLQKDSFLLCQKFIYPHNPLLFVRFQMPFSCQRGYHKFGGNVFLSIHFSSSRPFSRNSFFSFFTKLFSLLE